MAVPSELSLAEIRNFMLKNGGKVTNHELVKHFKQFLTNPDTKGKTIGRRIQFIYVELCGVRVVLCTNQNGLLCCVQ